MANTFQGEVTIQDDQQKTTILLDGTKGDLMLGGEGQYGELRLFGSSASNPPLSRVVPPSAIAKVDISAGQAGGKMEVRDGTGSTTFSLHGEGDVFLGGHGHNGSVIIHDEQGHVTIRLDGKHGHIVLGGPTVGLGGHAGDLFLCDQQGDVTISLRGEDGDIILSNADCAEEFELAEGEVIEPGAVMILDGGDKLKACRTAYDPKVAGVVSGAGSCRAGIILDRKPASARPIALALVGKVYCKVDATFASIEIGDLLTSSPTPGHAMKAADPTRAFGTVIGKALQPLLQGTGLIPVLAALQ